MLKIALIIVSDTCAQDIAHDTAGPALIELLSDTHDVVSRVACRDSVGEIRTSISHALYLFQPDVLLTCGGTGFSKKDVTPEAVEPMLEKKAPGIVHKMLEYSFKKTPYAINARPVAGVVGCTLVVTLPGSKKGAVENCESFIDMLPHICAQLKVDSARQIHESMASSSAPAEDHTHTHTHLDFNDHTHTHTHGHSHTHSHSHGASHSVKRHLLSNDLTQPVTKRARESPYPMIPVPEALELINKHISRSIPVMKSITDDDIAGHILAEDVFASISVPQFDASIVDGYAVIHTDGPGTYKVTNVSHAAVNEEMSISSGQIARVTTGAPLPLGTTAVVPVEETVIASTKVVNGREEEDEITILAKDVEKGDNVRKAGSDIKEGALALKKGTKISSNGGEVGLLASIGVMEVSVYAKPVIGVMSTGDELVDLTRSADGYKLKHGQIFDTNRPLLIQFFRSWGYTVKDLGIVSDMEGELADAMRVALDGVIDFLITTGGVSMGERDLVKPTIERELEGQIHFGRVAMKPGKPTTFATTENGVIFGLPGNPASASVTTHLFVLPALRKFAGYTDPTNPDALPCLSQIEVTLAQDAKLDPRPEYQRVFLHQQGHEIVAKSTGFQRSSRVGSIAGSNALAILPSSKDVPDGVLKKGTRVKAMVVDVL